MMFGQPRAISFGQPVNWGHPLCRGLVSWWLALPNRNRGSKWFDLCGRNHGTLTNMDPATDWQGSLGRPGGNGCLDFDGSNDYVTAPVAMASAPAVTMSAWCYRPSTGVWTTFGLGTSSGIRCILRWNTSNTLFFAIDGLFPSVTSTLTGWVHIVATYDGSAATKQVLYVNGKDAGLTGTQYSGGTLNASLGAEFRLGRSSDTQYGVGRHDDATVYDRVLSASEVSALYNDSRRGHPEMLNWIRPAYYVEAGGAPPAGNRRRRVLIGGAA